MTTNITKDRVIDYTITGKFSIPASVSPDKDSKDEKKKVTLLVVCNNTPLSQIVGSMLKDKRINWQSSTRQKFDSIVSGSTVEYNFSGGRIEQDPEDAMLSRLKAMTPEARAEWFQDKMEKLEVK